ncbi:flagellar biosynthesis protein FlhA [Donghicola tyrosinivorans]|uniref:Flagellar biosynthesis protein FlhA n=1 Tax=Donghicola tyrosinivorans TaxID=1652492 RepID=A0A2T0WY21_9RHOB|nr:flagellar biosynthesis protein FlhA [Donghicola tyrosinivorans]PRY91567.1 flagellar biosynthesis protein FlhA [Donghicola tyrosinivorans]
MTASVFKKIDTATALFSLGLLSFLAILIIPVPTAVLDVGLATSFAFSILIFVGALFSSRALDFSSFPTVLLASLMLRISLNVSSTKLIITNGHMGPSAAGGVIQSFSEFVVGGSLILGVIIFLVLMIVNFVVITKGATRMAEVSARFALDGLPGKQLAIDSDLAAGAITHQQAQEKRRDEQSEINFFGTLDGVSKFIKGDAVAGLLITALNFFVGMGVGLVSHDMPLGDAFASYSMLTIGDGLVTQIPSVIISIASGFLVSRGSSSVRADLEVVTQLGSQPLALFVVSLVLFLFGVFPGLPFGPFVICSIGIGAWGVSSLKGVKSNSKSVQNTEEKQRDPSIGDILDLDELHVRFSNDLLTIVLDPASGMEARIATMRRYFASEFGLVLTDIRLSDAAELETGEYQIFLQGNYVAGARLHSDKVLAILDDKITTHSSGIDAVEPVYGAPARWISQSEQEAVSLSGLTIVAPTEVLATHLLETIKSNLGTLMCLKTFRKTLEAFANPSDVARAEENKRLLDEIIPDRLPREALHGVLRDLLQEQVSIRNLALILEAAAEARAAGLRPDAVREHVRQRLGRQLFQKIVRRDGTIPIIQISPSWEERFLQHEVNGQAAFPDIGLPPEVFRMLSERISHVYQSVISEGHEAAIVVGVARRSFLKTVATAAGIDVSVLSYEEIGLHARPSVVGFVDE